MMANVSIYEFATKHLLLDLRDLARDKFKELGFSDWPIDEFAYLLREVHLTTPPDDAGLRTIVNDLCALHIEEVVADDDCMSVAIECSEFGLGLLRKTTQAYASSKAAHKESQTAQALALDWEKENANTIETLRGELAASRGQLSTKEDSLAQAKTVIAGLKKEMTALQSQVAAKEDVLKQATSHLSSTKQNCNDTHTMKNAYLKLQRDLASKESEMTSLRSQLWDEKAEAAVNKEEIELIESIFDTHEDCRHCYEALSRLEIDHNGNWMLRCAECRTRHWSPKS